MLKEKYGYLRFSFWLPTIYVLMAVIPIFFLFILDDKLVDVWNIKNTIVTGKPNMVTMVLFYILMVAVFMSIPAGVIIYISKSILPDAGKVYFDGWFMVIATIALTACFVYLIGKFIDLLVYAVRNDAKSESSFKSSP